MGNLQDLLWNLNALKEDCHLREQEISKNSFKYKLEVKKEHDKMTRNSSVSTRFDPWSYEVSNKVCLLFFLIFSIYSKV